jgi:Calcineurin-like phosphoesterase/Dictyostelium (slime mold) repeat/Iron/zinc purple acid phosphatase-like protein C
LEVVAVRNLALSFLLALSMARPGVAGARALTRGPYLQLLTRHSATVVWGTDTSGSCALSLQASGAASSIVAGSAGTTCTIALDALAPGTEYTYTPLDGAAALDVESTFHTDDPGRPFTFIAIGDHGDHNSSTQIPPRDRMLVTPADFIVSTGDMLYPDGGPQRLNPKFFTPYRDLIRKLVFWPCIGNHDAEFDGAASWRDAFITPANNPAHDEGYYSFDYGNAHLVVLDATQSVAPGSTQSRFLDQDLAATAATWKVVVYYRTLYSSSSAHGSALDDRAALVPVFDAHAVDLVFMGHDHDYERTVPLEGNHAVAPGAGTVYITTGGGGADIYPAGTSDFTAYSESAFHFVRVAVDGPTATVDMIRTDGSIGDTLVLSHGATTTTLPCGVCDDGNPCTDDQCEGGACVSTPIAGCCESITACDDGEACTIDTCGSEHQCQHARLAVTTAANAIRDSLAVDACAGDRVPRAIVQLVHHARALVARGRTRPGNVRRLAMAAERKLARALTRIERARTRGRLSEPCAGKLAAALRIDLDCLF